MEEQNKSEVVENAEKGNVNKQADEIIKLKQDLEETTDRMKRAMAEFENYKKRSSKERDMLYNTLVGDIVSTLLPVIDNLEQAACVETTDNAYKQGVELVLKQFKDVLGANGVKEIETVGSAFDPELHEAVSSVVDDTLEPNQIKEEYRKGYKIGTKVIRHAMVVVAS